MEHYLCKPEKEDHSDSIRTSLGDWRTVPFLYGKTGGNWMEWKIYEEWLDITLYRQMTNLIYKLSSNEEKYKIYMQLKENDMFLEKPKADMETAYGLHYPGEVLERIGEHLTLTKRTYRALGLALARMMPLQETCMFNGAQKDLFWKKMKQILGEKDLFLISINYICEEKEKNRWKQAMYTPKVMIVFG